MKDELLDLIIPHIKKNKMKQEHIAEILDTTQCIVSKLMNRKKQDLSVERLLHFLKLLGYVIDISIEKADKTTNGCIIIRVVE